MSSEKKKILIVVKTYPTPSTRYREIVCTAGVDEDGNWIRLYPIDYRDRDYCQWYRKYQWIEVEVQKHTQDPRPESYRPIGDIKIITSKPIPTTNNWAERKRYVLKKRNVKTMCWLNGQQQKTISLALIKPKEILNFSWEETSNEWTPKQKQAMEQMHLFDKNRPEKLLERIPYKFFYHFYCQETNCRGHKMMIEDWEVCELFRKMRDKYGEKKALEKVKEKFLCKICSPERDTYFIVGTVLKYGKWIIIGTFWPPKT